VRSPTSFQRSPIASPGAKTGVGQNGDERGVEVVPAVQQVGAHPLDRLWREWAHDSVAAIAWLADAAGGVCVEPAPFDGSLEDVLK
jgi:hypothetical protein